MTQTSEGRKRLPPVLSVILAITGILIVSGLGGTVVGLMRSLEGVNGESIDPSQKARILAERISEAMNCTAAGVVVGVVVGVPILVWWLAGKRMGKDGDDEDGAGESGSEEPPGT